MKAWEGLSPEVARRPEFWWLLYLIVIITTTNNKWQFLHSFSTASYWNSCILLVFLFEQVSKARPKITCSTPPQWSRSIFNPVALGSKGQKNRFSQQTEKKKPLLSLQSSTGMEDCVSLVRNQTAESQMLNWIAKTYSSPAGNFSLLPTLSPFFLPDTPEVSLSLLPSGSALTTTLVVICCFICNIFILYWHR